MPVRRPRQGEIPVGAVVVKDGAVIGRGRNRREAARSVLGHAELEAMEQAAEALGDWRLSGCTLYVTLEPCPMCAGAAVNARVERIVYGAEDEVMGACGTAVSVIRLPRAFRPALYKGPARRRMRRPPAPVLCGAQKVNGSAGAESARALFAPPVPSAFAFYRVACSGKFFVFLDRGGKKVYSMKYKAV